MWPRSDLRKQRIREAFQYRKRYEVTCDSLASTGGEIVSMFQYRKRYEVTYDFTISTFIDKDTLVSIPQAVWGHMWRSCETSFEVMMTFQYRKRYEVTCDPLSDCQASRSSLVSIPQAVWGHMWPEESLILHHILPRFNTASGMRSHVTMTARMMRFTSRVVSIPQAVWGHMWLASTNSYIYVSCPVSIPQAVWGHMWLWAERGSNSGWSSFNTASGMRSHVTSTAEDRSKWIFMFQYRKRYEVTCDLSSSTKLSWSIASMGFQYRKRYEVTCDLTLYTKHGMDLILVSIPQAVWGHMWLDRHYTSRHHGEVSIPQAVWGHMWHGRLLPPCWKGPGVSIPQAVWGHMWLMTGVLLLLAADAAWVFQYRKRYEVTCDKARYLPKDANV